jgi:hemolysin III
MWLIAAAGVSLYLTLGTDSVPKWLSTTVFVVMGWMAGSVVMAENKFMSCAGPWPAILVAVGGVIYTVGGLVFYMEWPNPVPGKFCFHEIWHCAVLVAAMTHWVAVKLTIGAQ